MIDRSEEHWFDKLGIFLRDGEDQGTGTPVNHDLYEEQTNFQILLIFNVQNSTTVNSTSIVTVQGTNKIFFFI